MIKKKNIYIYIYILANEERGTEKTDVLVDRQAEQTEQTRQIKRLWAFP